MPNITNWPLAWRTLFQLIDHPETHDQAIYVSPCGTNKCFAGWTVVLEGYAFAEDFRGHIIDYVQLPHDQLRSVHSFAVELLGLADDDDEYASNVDDLFGGGNTLWDIITLLCNWAEQDGEQIPERVTRVASWMEEHNYVELTYYKDYALERAVREGIPA
jgi:hypothetical protein